MADRKPLFYTLRKHRKKSIFFAAVGAWLVNYGVNRFRDYLTRRQFCEEAKTYAEETLPALRKPRRLMVFFNATSGKGEGEKLFERNAEPLFHLAALDVTIVKTDYEGQIKKLMQYIDPSIDGIIVAGGDGTLLEAVTGLLRRSDQEEVSKIPIGVIPVGTKNTFFNRVFGESKLSQSRQIGNAVMSIVRGSTTPVDVMEIRGEGGRPTFAMNGIRWGAFRDTAESYDKYWITGPFRQKMAYIMKTVTDWPPVHSASISYPKADLTVRPAMSASTTNTPGSISWRSSTQAMASTADNNPGSVAVESSTVNGWVTTSVETLGLTIEPATNPKDDRLIKLKMWPSDLSKIDFIKLGWKMENQTLSEDQDSAASCIIIKEVKFESTDNNTSWFNIDGEPFDARPVHVTLHPGKLAFFNSQESKK